MAHKVTNCVAFFWNNFKSMSPSEGFNELITQQSIHFLQCELLFIQCNTKPLSMCVRTYVSYTTYLVHYNAVLCHTYFCVPEAFSFLPCSRLHSFYSFAEALNRECYSHFTCSWHGVPNRNQQKFVFCLILVSEYNGI